MNLELVNRRALVLGSSDGLGMAIAEGLVAEGAQVAINGRNADRLREASERLGALAIPGDLVTDADRVVTSAIDALGGLDVLVVNTAGGAPGGLLDNPPAATEAAFASMLRPALTAARTAVQALRASGRGRLLFIAARSVLEATPGLALSSIFRSGVAAAARSLAVELAPEVLVNVVVPGQFDTGAYQRLESWQAQRNGTTTELTRSHNLADTPLGRLGRAEELSDVVVFLCSARSSYVTGSIIRVDGGAVKGF
ncbi:MAG: SDR family oxidoreductase [Actinomycetota bacterium]